MFSPQTYKARKPSSSYFHLTKQYVDIDEEPQTSQPTKTVVPNVLEVNEGEGIERLSDGSFTVMFARPCYVAYCLGAEIAL